MVCTPIVAGSTPSVPDSPANHGETSLAAREEIIARLLKSAEMHDLDDAQMGAASIHAAAAALIEKTGVSKRQAGEALQTSVRRYLADVNA